MPREKRREKIVDAAFRVFSRYGFRDATTRRLARAAGITEVTLFRYFPTKEHLYGAVLDKYSALPVLRTELLEEAKRSKGRDVFRKMTERILEILAKRSSMIRIVVTDAVKNRRYAKATVHQGAARYIEDVSAVLSELHRRGEIRDVDIEGVSHAVLGFFYSFILSQELLYGKEARPLEYERAVEVFSDLLWRGVCPDSYEGKRDANL